MVAKKTKTTKKKVGRKGPITYEGGKFVGKKDAKQVPARTDIKADKKRAALRPGKRKSRSGKTYYETRDNRSDKNKRRT